VVTHESDALVDLLTVVFADVRNGARRRLLRIHDHVVDVVDVAVAFADQHKRDLLGLEDVDQDLRFAGVNRIAAEGVLGLIQAQLSVQCQIAVKLHVHDRQLGKLHHVAAGGDDRADALFADLAQRLPRALRHVMNLVRQKCSVHIKENGFDHTDITLSVFPILPCSSVSSIALAPAGQKHFPPVHDRASARLLLGDAVDVAAAEGNLLGQHAHDFPVREHGLHLLHRQSVVLVAVLGENDGAVDNQEVHVRGNGNLAILSGNGSLHRVDGGRALQQAGLFGQAQLVYLQLAALGIRSFAQSFVGGLCLLIERILRILGPNAGHLAGGDEAGHVVDMTVGLVGIDAVLDPDDLLAVQVVAQHLLDLFLALVGVPALGQQAHLGG